MPRLGTGLGTGAVSGDERHADGVAFESLDDLGAAHSALPDVKRKPRVAAGVCETSSVCRLMRPAGIEPATSRSGGARSIP
jgi:hypothetical protein